MRAASGQVKTTDRHACRPRLLEPRTNAKDVSVGMAHVHFPNTPWLVAWRAQDFEALADTCLVQRVNIVHPDRQPHALEALSVETQKELAVAGLHRCKARRAICIAPIPLFGPAQFGEPIETGRQVRDVE